MAYIDARLVSEWDDWDLDSTLAYVKNAVLDFVEDSTKYDKELVAEIFALLDFDDIEPTYEYVMDQLDKLNAEEVVSSREVMYLNRLFQFTYNGDTTASVFTDSLEAFKNDVLAIEWEKDEVLCLTFTSVIVHSWNFQYVGLNFDPGVPVDFSWGRMGAADLGGAVTGGLIGSVGGPKGALVGCLLGGLGNSAIDAINQNLGY